jgi:hypothetical protein
MSTGKDVPTFRMTLMPSFSGSLSMLVPEVEGKLRCSETSVAVY